MPLWGFALFCLVACSGWMFAATFYGMYRIEKRVRLAIDQQWTEIRAHWNQVATKAGLIEPDPILRVVKPPEKPS